MSDHSTPTAPVGCTDANCKTCREEQRQLSEDAAIDRAVASRPAPVGEEPRVWQDEPSGLEYRIVGGKVQSKFIEHGDERWHVSPNDGMFKAIAELLAESRSLGASPDAKMWEQSATELSEIIWWLLGERDELPARPDGAGLYWWRRELRARFEDFSRAHYARSVGASHPSQPETGSERCAESFGGLRCFLREGHRGNHRVTALPVTVADVRKAIGLREDADLIEALRDMVHRLGRCMNGVCHEPATPSAVSDAGDARLLDELDAGWKLMEQTARELHPDNPLRSRLLGGGYRMRLLANTVADNRSRSSVSPDPKSLSAKDVENLRTCMLSLDFSHFGELSAASARAQRSGRSKAVDALDHIHSRLSYLDHVLGTRDERLARYDAARKNAAAVEIPETDHGK